jgi:hypothetical protein
MNTSKQAKTDRCTTNLATRAPTRSSTLPITGARSTRAARHQRQTITDLMRNEAQLTTSQAYCGIKKKIGILCAKDGDEKFVRLVI